MWALQHRGQESSGIVSSDGKQLYGHNGSGLVATVYHEEDLEQLAGHIAIGHNRYSTSGGGDSRYNQPYVDHIRQFAFAHNGNIPDCSKLEAFLQQRGVKTVGLNDSAMMFEAIAAYIDDGLNLTQAIKKAYPLFTGVFSAVAMDKTTVVAFRDECGIRPLSIGSLNGSYVIASETCAFDTIGASFVRDVKPGELVTINQKGITATQVVKGRQKLDIFEFVYFARPDSLLLGKRVDEVRKRFGKEMAKEFAIDADVVIPIPDSGIPAALGYARATGIPFDIGLIKNRYIHRTFIRPTAQLRRRDLRMKLNPVIETVRGKRVILVDDSIVRGSTVRQMVAMLYEAQAKEVHLLITSPPVLYPDFYGINTPSQSELIATQMTNEQLREHVGATSLNYLSFDGMIRATGLPAKVFSTSCFSGDYPISIGSHAKEVRRYSVKDFYGEASQKPNAATGRVAILVSGEGTTAEAFIKAALRGKILSRVGLVISNRRNAGAAKRIDRLNKKFNLNIEYRVINSATNPPGENEVVAPGCQTASEEAAIAQALEKGKFDLVVLMGYMKRVGPRLVKKFGWRSGYQSIYDAQMLNTHPGLLPDTIGLYGEGVQQHVLAKKLPYAGQTLHVVAEEYDKGPKIAEHRIVVKAGETSDRLFKRVKTIEKRFLPSDIENFMLNRQRYLHEHSREA